MKLYQKIVLYSSLLLGLTASQGCKPQGPAESTPNPSPQSDSIDYAAQSLNQLEDMKKAVKDSLNTEGLDSITRAYFSAGLELIDSLQIIISQSQTIEDPDSFLTRFNASKAALAHYFSVVRGLDSISGTSENPMDKMFECYLFGQSALEYNLNKSGLVSPTLIDREL